MDQEEALTKLEEILGHKAPYHYYKYCKGDAKICKLYECMLCGVRDCPDNEPLHYHHDGCPSCYFKENK